MGGERVRCDLPECQRTIGVERYRKLFKHEPGGWVCSSHWKRVPRRMKRVLSRVRRQGKRLSTLTGHNPFEAREWRVWRRIWQEITA